MQRTSSNSSSNYSNNNNNTSSIANISSAQNVIPSNSTTTSANNEAVSVPVALAALLTSPARLRRPLAAASSPLMTASPKTESSNNANQQTTTSSKFQPQQQTQHSQQQQKQHPPTPSTKPDDFDFSEFLNDESGIPNDQASIDSQTALQTPPALMSPMSPLTDSAALESDISMPLFPSLSSSNQVPAWRPSVTSNQLPFSLDLLGGLTSAATNATRQSIENTPIATGAKTDLDELMSASENMFDSNAMAHRSQQHRVLPPTTNSNGNFGDDDSSKLSDADTLAWLLANVTNGDGSTDSLNTNRAGGDELFSLLPDMDDLFNDPSSASATHQESNSFSHITGLHPSAFDGASPSSVPVKIENSPAQFNFANRGYEDGSNAFNVSASLFQDLNHGSRADDPPLIFVVPEEDEEEEQEDDEDQEAEESEEGMVKSLDKKSGLAQEVDDDGDYVMTNATEQSEEHVVKEEVTPEAEAPSLPSVAASRKRRPGRPPKRFVQDSELETAAAPAPTKSKSTSSAATGRVRKNAKNAGSSAAAQSSAETSVSVPPHDTMDEDTKPVVTKASQAKRAKQTTTTKQRKTAAAAEEDESDFEMGAEAALWPKAAGGTSTSLFADLNSEAPLSESDLSLATFRPRRPMDEDLAAQYELLKDPALSARERRQLRNKLSARSFRERRREYIETLEGEVLRARKDAREARTEVEKVTRERDALKAVVAELSAKLEGLGLKTDEAVAAGSAAGSNVNIPASSRTKATTGRSAGSSRAIAVHTVTLPPSPRLPMLMLPSPARFAQVNTSSETQTTESVNQRASDAAVSESVNAVTDVNSSRSSSNASKAAIIKQLWALLDSPAFTNPILPPSSLQPTSVEPSNTSNNNNTNNSNSNDNNVARSPRTPRSTTANVRRRRRVDGIDNVDGIKLGDPTVITRGMMDAQNGEEDDDGVGQEESAEVDPELVDEQSEQQQEQQDLLSGPLSGMSAPAFLLARALAVMSLTMGSSKGGKVSGFQ
ncbi:hypothetical protein HDU76_013028, partial [Blyttiomyces sp. JEL0837]